MVTSAEMLPLIVGQISSSDVENLEADADALDTVEAIELPDTDGATSTANADAPPADFVINDDTEDTDESDRKKDAT